MTRDIPAMKREYRATAEKYAVPDLKEGFERVPPFKFELPEFEGGSVFTVDPIFGPGSQTGSAAQPQDNRSVSYKKPAHLSNLHSEPQYLISCDPRELEQAAKDKGILNQQPEIYRPTQT